MGASFRRIFTAGNFFMNLVSSNAKILVTGGSGFMGSSFIRYLLGSPDFTGKIINYDLLTYAVHPGSLKAIETSPKYKFIQGDVTSSSHLETLFSTEEIDAVVHFAAQTHVDRSIEGPSVFMETNIRGTFTLLELVRKYPHVHFHHISTDEVYGSLGESGAFYEHSSYRPNSPYAASKAASDHLVRAYANTYQISTTISHASNNYGPYQFPEKFIPLMIRNCIEGKKLPIYGSGRNIRDWLFVEDHARAIWMILQKGRKGEVYNIAGGRELSNLELLEKIFLLLSYELNIPKEQWEKQKEFVSDRKGHDFRYFLDPAKIQKEIGFFPKVSLETGLQKTVRWMIKQMQRKTYKTVLKSNP